MMFKYSVVACWLLSATSAWGQNSPGLRVLPEQPRAGSVVALRYSPTAAESVADQPLKAVVYLYVDFAWRADSLVLTKKDGDWQATYRLPATCAFAALRFYQGPRPAPSVAGSPDLAQPGYSIVPRDKKGHRLPGGAIAEAIFLLPTLDEQRPAGFPSHTRPAPETLASLLGEELSRKDASPKQFVRPYLELQHVLLGNRFAAEAAPVLAPLLQAPLPTAEADLLTLHRVYQYELKDVERASQLEAVIRQRYPKGNFARQAAFTALSKHSKAQELVQVSEQFLLDFPPADLLPSSRQGYLYYEVYRLLGTAYFETGNYQKILAMRPKWNFKTANEIYRWNITRAYTFKTVNTDSLYRLSTGLLRDLLTKIDDGSYRETGVFNAEQAAHNAHQQLDDRLNTQISLVIDLQKYPEALAYFPYLSSEGRYADATLNEKHLLALEALGKPIEALTVLESSVRANAVTPAMFAKLKQTYQASHHGLGGYEEYLATLRSKEEIAKMHTYVEKNLLSQEYMPFALEDAGGQLVRSSDWESKIVVLDFWATWCGPCIRAFPGMQMLVDKYATDPQVGFYFVGTMQTENYKEKDVNYLKQNGYRFKLLLDNVDPKTGQQDAVFKTFAPIFKSSGIPRKVILKDGVIRYSSEGYSGSPSQLADEISYAIELLKKG